MNPSKVDRSRVRRLTDLPNIGRAEHVKSLAPGLPLDRLASSEEIAAAYLYLFGNRYSTGSVVVVDGGAVC